MVGIKVTQKLDQKFCLRPMLGNCTQKWSVDGKGLGVTEAKPVGFDTSLATGRGGDRGWML